MPEHLHSNMFLLILHAGLVKMLKSVFTFQYVSINTLKMDDGFEDFLNLHSNMFLLMRSKSLL